MPDMVGQLMEAAVAAAVAQVLSARDAAATPVAGSPGPPAYAASTERQRQPLWRAALHLDVVLPLLAMLIVFVVLLAWVG